ncbi:MAG: hypothetical protein MUO34_12670 [Ignavibacteriaceae bacterium]|nr:hypothetical protein [Ignavibacteriaceae bacterium]
MDTIEILIVILLISASALCIALIYFVYQVVKSVHSISTDIQGISYKLSPLIQSTFVLSEKLIHVTDEAESQLQISKSIVSDIRDHADKILNVETKIRNGIEDAIIPVVKNLHAVGKGVESFWRRFRNK